jgi:hypothetical protein
LQEERFLYPIYPLLAYIAGNTLDHMLHTISTLFGAKPSAVSPAGKGKTSAKVSPQVREAAWVSGLKTGLLLVCMVCSLVLFAARVASNSTNYGGDRTRAVHLTLRPLMRS